MKFFRRKFWRRFRYVYANFHIYALGSVDVRIVIIYKEKIITYVDEDKLISVGKFVLVCFLAQRCRGPPHAQNFEI